MTRNCRWPLLLTLTVAALVTGCGGGGGGGSAPPPTSPTPPPIPTVSVSAANAQAVAGVGISSVERSYQPAYLAYRGFLSMVERAGQTLTRGCSSGGTNSETFSLVDADGSGTVSVGDSVSASFVDCFTDEVEETFTGDVSARIDRLDITNERAVIAELTVTLPQGLLADRFQDDTVTLRGSFSVRVFAALETQILEITTAAGQSITVQRGSGLTATDDVIEVAALTRTSRASDIETTDAQFTVDSDTLEGTLSCDTDLLTGPAGGNPTTGSLSCSGDGGGTLRIDAAPLGALTLAVDSGDTGTFTPVAGVPTIWRDYGLYRAFFNPLPVLSSQFAFDVPLVDVFERQISLNEMIYSSARDRLYVSNDLGIVELDPVTLATERTLALSGRPGPLAVSDDGTRLWVGLQDVNEIVPVELANFTAEPAFSLGIRASFSTARIARDIEVVPGSTDTIVVAAENTREVLAFENGVARPNVAINDTVREIEFDGPTTVIGVTSGSPTIGVLMDLTANGIDSLKSERNFLDIFSTIEIRNGVGISSRGLRFNLANDQRLGRYEPPSVPFPEDVLIDDDAGRVYFVSDDRLWFHDLVTGRLLGVYRLALATGFNRTQLVQADNGDLLVTGSSSIQRIASADLVEIPVNFACSTVDLSGLVLTGPVIQTSCAFNDAVYDSQRDVIYASLQPTAGTIGNSIAIVNPTTGTIDSRIELGVEPTQLALSASAAQLYALIESANRVAVISLNTQQVTSYIELGYEQPFGGPNLPSFLSASPQVETSLVVSSDDSITQLTNGQFAPAETDRVSSPASLFHSADGATLFVTNFSSELFVYSLTPGSITQLDQFTQVFASRDAAFRDNKLYAPFGRVYDAPTGNLLATCDVQGEGVLAEPGTSEIVYVTQGFDKFLVRCDETTEVTSTPVPLEGVRVPGATNLLRTNAGLLVIQTPTKLLLIDDSQL